MPHDGSSRSVIGSSTWQRSRLGDESTSVYRAWRLAAASTRRGSGCEGEG
ncbi:hypothetical protein HMPREF9570_00811 [Cutibacterium acnes HL043PA1]|nr:hypothetical protein HMPREF9570_00811 [Cutibacterium acnes HL043PA1]